MSSSSEGEGVEMAEKGLTWVVVIDVWPVVIERSVQLVADGAGVRRLKRQPAGLSRQQVVIFNEAILLRSHAALSPRSPYSVFE